jgi:hypothetical protein
MAHVVCLFPFWWSPRTGRYVRQELPARRRAGYDELGLGPQPEAASEALQQTSEMVSFFAKFSLQNQRAMTWHRSNDPIRLWKVAKCFLLFGFQQEFESVRKFAFSLMSQVVSCKSFCYRSVIDSIERARSVLLNLSTHFLLLLKATGSQFSDRFQGFVRNISRARFNDPLSFCHFLIPLALS